MNATTIYHLLHEADFGRCVRGDAYLPERFDADGFIHCTADLATLVQVANDYFADAPGAVLVLAIDTRRLRSRVVFEAAAPIPGGGSSHLADGALFPHVYGTLNLDAVTGWARLPRRSRRYARPRRFAPGPPK